jgi:sialate O-acetylesterase
MADAVAYGELFAAMIQSWREAWQHGDLPFFWVQLANFMAVNDDPPAESNWAVLREAQSAALALPNTGQAIIIDIGEADDIHPRNKQDVGGRLALAARKVAYGEDVVYSGPTFRECEFRDGRATIWFDHVGSGLVARGGALRGFAVAGPDGRFIWADARIDGDRVVVWSDSVSDPAAVRYAWANNPAAANLYNAEGLPAGPFRTDRW